MASPPIYRDPLDGTEMVRVLKDGRFYMAPLSAVAAVVLAPVLARLTALEAATAALSARVSAIEGRPEEVAHFTASAKLPALSVLAPVTLQLTGLVPARAGDVLKAGETVEVEPATPLPAGVNKSAAVVTADGVVSLQLTASISVAAGAAAIVWNIAALR